MDFGSKQSGSDPPSPAQASAARVMRSCSRCWPPASIVPNAAAEPGAEAIHATSSNDSSTVNRRRRTAHAFRLGSLAPPLTNCVARFSRRPHPARVTGGVAFPDYAGRHAPHRHHLVRDARRSRRAAHRRQAGEGRRWGSALAAGLVGSFIGGLIISLLSGDGLALRPSGIIGSLAGAIIVTIAWQWWLTPGRGSRGGSCL